MTSAILLAPALAPSYPLSSALDNVERGIWNFWSPLDVIFLGAGTLLLGTIDGKWQLSSGLIGFHLPVGTSVAQRQAYQQKLHQQTYAASMARSFNFGGHFGCTNRVFIETWVGPLLGRSVVSGP